MSYWFLVFFLVFQQVSSIFGKMWFPRSWKCVARERGERERDRLGARGDIELNGESESEREI
jgi:hypothetical protein